MSFMNIADNGCRPDAKKPFHKMMDGKKAVIFDMDGTLVDSMWIWKEIDIAYLGARGITLPEDLQACVNGMSFLETALYFKERFSLPDSPEKIKADWNEMAWDRYMHQVPLKPGIPEFLAECTKRGILLGIASSNSRELVANVADVHGLHHSFSCIMTACEVGRGKPAPDIYLAVADKLQADPKHCLVFEDVLPGIQAGLNAGMEVCAVDDVYSAKDRDAKKELAHYFIEDYRRITF